MEQDGEQMTKQQLMEDLDTIEQVMERTVPRSDIWQDECVYAMAKIIRDLLLEERKKMQ